MNGKMGILAAGIVIAIILAGIGVYYYTIPSEKESGNIIIRDDMGRTVVLNKTPERIVSLAPSNTEILFAIGAGHRVVGVTEFCNYPPEAVEGVKNGSIEVVGGFTRINVEKIVSLEPDVVFAYFGQEKEIKQLENLSIPTIVFNPKNLGMIYNDILIAGRVTGLERNAEKVVNEMKEKVNYVVSKVSALEKRRVFYVLWGDPLMSVGGDTFIGQLINLAGGENIFGDTTGWPTVNMESVVERNPDVIILDPYCGVSKEDVLNNWSREINAVKNGSVYVVSNQDLIVRAGPRIADGLEMLAEIIHPEAFETKALWMEGEWAQT